MKRVTVYCASSQIIHADYFAATELLAKELVKNNIEAVFGGGKHGLMGKLADTMLAEGGKIKGIMPKFMDDIEWGHPEVLDFHFTATMSERKMKLIEDTDGIITLAGGCGTFEELMEVVTLKRLGIFMKPIVILNTRNYYAPLKQLFENAIAENFMAPAHRSMWTFVDTPEEVLPALQNAVPWNEEALKYAVPK
jgi:uncharacterized protein (TIGR00730 family)